MNTEDFGWKKYVASFPALAEQEAHVARVAVENRTNFLLYSALGELEGVALGKMKRDAALMPKVGDFVTISKLQGEQKAVIETVLPRHTKISRGVEGVGEQIIAANVDIVFIVQALDADFNMRRLERYISVAKSGGCEYVVVLNKSDVSNTTQQQLREAKEVAGDSVVLLSSTQNGEGIEQIRSLIPSGATVVFMGSSGVGKSSLINSLTNSNSLKTQPIRVSDGKGVHTTTRRELILLPNGICIIDTPGMRELEVFSGGENKSLGTFFDIEAYFPLCKFTDCDHVKSEGCAVVAAVKSGELSEARYKSFLKLTKEVQFQKSKDDPFQRKANNKKNKTIHKSLKKFYAGSKKYKG